jgi:hypothetical protein
MSARGICARLDAQYSRIGPTLLCVLLLKHIETRTTTVAADYLLRCWGRSGKGWAVFSMVRLESSARDPASARSRAKFDAQMRWRLCASPL